MAKPAALPTTLAVSKILTNDSVPLLPNETVETGFADAAHEKPMLLAVSDKASLQEKPLLAKSETEKPITVVAIEAKPIKKKASKKVIEKKANDLPDAFVQNTQSENQAKPVIKTAELTPVNAVTSDSGNQKSGWKIFTDSVKQGQERACTQAEITMNQCHQ